MGKSGYRYEFKIPRPELWDWGKLSRAETLKRLEELDKVIRSINEANASVSVEINEKSREIIRVSPTAFLGHMRYLKREVDQLDREARHLDRQLDKAVKARQYVKDRLGQSATKSKSLVDGMGFSNA